MTPKRRSIDLPVLRASRDHTRAELRVGSASARRIGLAGQSGWAFLLLMACVLPAITWTERTTFAIAGASLNARVLIYFVVAAVAFGFSVPIVWRMETRPFWLNVAIVMTVWLAITSVVAHQTPVEWLPTLVRYTLYFSTALICYWFGQSPPDRSGLRFVSRVTLVALVAAMAIPALAGLVEFARGTAPLLNGARRVAGTMPTHPAAYSLTVAVGAVAGMGLGFLAGRKWLAIVAWLTVGAMTFVVFATYTRLTIVMLVMSLVAIAALLPVSPRVRATRIGASLLVGVVVMFLAVPTFNARFTYPTRISTIIGGEPTKPPTAAPTHTAAPVSSSTMTAGSTKSASLTPKPSESANSGGVLDVSVDNSIAYRIMLHEHGLKYIAQSPLLGYGPGSFDRLFMDETGQTDVAAHDDFLSLAVESGIPGLAIWMLLLWVLIRSLWIRRSTGIPEVDVLIVTALIALGAFNVMAAIENPAYFVELELPVWILVGTALGIRKRAALIAATSKR